MQDFNDIQNLWKQEENTSVSIPKINFKLVKTYQRKLRNTYLRGAILLSLTGVFIFVLMNLLDEKIRTNLVIASMILVSLICILQAILYFINANKINKIDESNTPTEHLKQWQEFNEFRKKQIRWNLPIYYLILGSALAVYMFELLKNGDLWKIILIFAVTYTWMLFAYFYLGKKELKKQEAKIDGIIDELKGLENQFL